MIIFDKMLLKPPAPFSGQEGRAGVPHNIRTILERLNSSEYRVTWQRWAIIKEIVLNKDRQLSAEDVYNLIKQDYPEIGLATIYRTLDLLTDLGMLQRVSFGDGKTRYGLADGGSQYQNHLICVRCGAVEAFDEAFLRSLEEAVGEANQFQVIDHEVKFFGVCKACQKEAPARQRS